MLMYRVVLLVVLVAVVAQAQDPGLLTASLQAFGPTAQMQDIVLTGYGTGPDGVAQPLKAFVKDKAHFRFESGNADSLQISIFNNARGWAISRSGTHELPSHVALQRPDFLPF